jgi:hypothetical protein
MLTRERSAVTTRTVTPKHDFRRVPVATLLAYSSAPAALSMNSSLSRTYLASIASLAWPVCLLILNVETPACTALVAKPARRLWPEKPVGLNDGFNESLPSQLVWAMLVFQGSWFRQSEWERIERELNELRRSRRTCHKLPD